MLTQHINTRKLLNSKSLLVFVIVIASTLLFSLTAFSQSAGDYRSTSTGDWSILSTWQRYDGSAWAIPTVGQGYPGQNIGTGVVTIQGGHEITLNVSPAQPLGSLIVEGSYTTNNNTRTITVSGNLTVANGGSMNLRRSRITINGITSINGSLVDDNNDGWAVFVGLFTINNTGSFSTTNTSPFTFRSGIVNNGVFNKTGAGLVTFSTNNQTISGSNAITMGGIIEVTDVTVNNNLLELNLIRANGNDIRGTGTWVQGNNTTLYTTATSIGIATLDCATHPNTVVFNRNNTQTIPGIIFHNLILTNGSTKTLGAATVVNNDFTLDNGTTFNPAAQNFTVIGNSIIAGTINDNNIVGITTLNHVNFSAGSMNGSATGVVVVNGDLAVSSANGTIGRIDLTVGGTTSISTERTLTLNNVGVKTFVGSVIIDGTWTSTAITTATNLIFRNGITNNNAAVACAISAATFNTNNQSLSGVGRYTFTGASIIEGAITLTNESSHANGVTFTGTINGTDAGSTLANGANRNMYYNNATQPMAIGTLNASAAGNNFYYTLAGAQTVKAGTYHNLFVQSGNIKTLGGNVIVNNVFTLPTGTTFNPAANDITVYGNSVIAGVINDNNVAGTSTFNNVNLSAGSMNGTATGVVVIGGDLSVSTANGTIGRVALTVNGTTNIAPSRVITFNAASVNGVKTFVGSVVIDGTWTSTAITTAANLVFRNGIVNNNAAVACAIGGAIFNTNNQSLSGVGRFTFANTSTIEGAIILTNESSHTNGVTFTGAINGTVAGSTLANGANRNMYYNNATQPMAIGTLNASAAGNNFYYTLAGAQTVKAGTYHNLFVQSGNIKTLGGNVIVNGDFTLPTGTTFNPAANDITVSGNSIIAGTFADGTLAGTTTLQNVNLSGGSINGAAAGVVNVDGNLSISSANGTIGLVDLTVNGTTSISAGRTLTLNNNTGVKTFAGAVTNEGTWTSTTITTAANLIFQNGFTNNSATNVAFGGATFSTNNQELAGSGSFTFANTSFISGAITLTNNSSHVNGVTFNYVINGTEAGSTYANAANRVTYYNANVAATQPMVTGTIVASADGNTFHYNRNTTATIKPTTYHHLIISGGNTKTLGGNTIVNGDFSHVLGTFNPSAFDFTVNGNSTISATLSDNNASGTVNFENVSLSGGIITGSVASVVNVNGNLSVASGNGTIGLVTLNVLGTTSISNGRILTLNNSAGVKTFINTVTNNGTWTSAITTTSNLVLQNGFTNNSATNASFSAATFSTNNQQLAGTGSFTFSGTVEISGPITLTNNSSNISGVIFSNIINGTVAGSTYANGSGSITTYQPGAATMPMATGTLDCSTSSNTFAYNRAAAQTIKATTYHNLNIQNGGTKSLSGATTVNGNLNIVSLTTFDVTTSNHALSVGGNWNNAGTFIGRSGTVTFNGNAPQSISSNTSNFYNVVFNNTASGSGAIVLSDDMTITNLCTMTDGIIFTGANRVILTNATAANLSGFSNESYVNGNLRRHIANNTSIYAFPVGNGSNYYRADIKNNNLNGITYIDANYGSLVRHDDVDMDVNDGPTLNYISIASNMWTIDPNAAPSSGSYDIYLYTTNISGINDNEFAVIKRPTGSPDATSWTTGGGTINAAGGNGRKVSDGYALRMSLTSFSEFGIGSTQAGNPLPVQLVSFTAKLNRQGAVDFKWVTATEINNDFFSVERSIDGINFEEILQVRGAGNTSRTITYNAVDGKPLTGVSYYRLKQTDFDGTFEYSHIVSVNNKGLVPVANRNWNVFPNPLQAGSLMKVSADGETEKITVAIFDTYSGKLIAEKVSNTGTTEIDLSRNLKPGVYIVNITEGEITTSKRIIVQ